MTEVEKIMAGSIKAISQRTIVHNFPVTSIQPGKLRPDVGDLLKHSFVISVNEDRLNIFKRLFEANFLEIPEKIAGCTDRKLSKTWMRITASHLKCVKEAKARGWPFVVIFEDDAYPCDGIKEKLEFVRTNIPEDAEIICLNWTNLKCSYKNILDMSKSPFIRLEDGNTVWGSACNMVFSDAYDKFIDYHHELNHITDSYSYKFFRTYVSNYPLFI